MPDTGWTYSESQTNITTNIPVWDNKWKVEDNDGVGAYFLYEGLSAAEDGTNRWRAYNFGFSIPTTAIIDGIYVFIERRKAYGDWVRDNIIRLVQGTTYVGSNKAKTGTNWPSSWGGTYYGSASNMWGTSLTASDINNSNFGIAIKARYDPEFYSSGWWPHRIWGYRASGEIDRIMIRVYYTEISGVHVAQQVMCLV